MNLTKEQIRQELLNKEYDLKYWKKKMRHCREQIFLCENVYMSSSKNFQNDLFTFEKLYNESLKQFQALKQHLTDNFK